MSEGAISLILLAILGVICGIVAYLVMNRISKKLIWFFQLYPESQLIINLASKFISGFVSIIIFLLFLRKGLLIAGLDFTSKFIEDTILILPKYLTAVIIIIFGKFAIKIMDNVVEKYDFEYKQEFLAIVNTILLIAFILTAFFMIGINVDIFSEIFKTIVFSLGMMIALIIGIPVGLRVYESGKMKEGPHRKKSNAARKHGIKHSLDTRTKKR